MIFPLSGHFTPQQHPHSQAFDSLDSPFTSPIRRATQGHRLDSSLVSIPSTSSVSSYVLSPQDSPSSRLLDKSGLKMNIC